MTPPPMDDGPAAGSGGSAGRTATYTHYHSQFLAHLLTVEGTGDEALAKTLTSARVDMNPHQVDAALFALRSPLSKGVLLADEVGLGKTIEAALVMAQRWAERRRRILLVVPASLRKQWAAELWDKFGLPTLIMESRVHTERRKAGIRRPFEADNAVVVVSYEFAARKAAEIAAIGWDLVVLDEAHRLRNVHKQGPTSRARLLRDALRAPFKVLLTATPLQNSLTELYGLVSFMDEHVFGDELAFRTRFASGGREGLLLLRERLRPICLRTLRRTVMEAGHISYTRRTPVTFRFEPHPEEQDLYERVSEFLQRENTVYLGGKPNALVTMALRKILGSSSYAIALTLTGAEETEEAAQKLQALETDTATEVVVHVNKLKEGWDVTNLFTIVPLRAAASDILTEQTLGRGLRLPFGQRTGVEAIDRLTVIAHDRFDAIIAAARAPGSLVKMKAVTIGEDGDISPTKTEVVVAPPLVESMLTNKGSGLAEGQDPFPRAPFQTPSARAAATVTLDVISRMGRQLGGIEDLAKPEVQARIVEQVRQATRPVQGTLDGLGTAPEPDVTEIVKAVAKQVQAGTIEIPEIVVIPDGGVTFTFRDFDLANLSSIAYRPLDQEILMHQLRTEARSTISIRSDGVREERPEDYLVRELVVKPEVDYDAHADFLYKLAGQVVERLRSYLATEDEVERVLLQHARRIANEFIAPQMMQHYAETATTFRVEVQTGFQGLKSQSFAVPEGSAPRDFRMAVTPRGDTRKHVFAGFSKCCYALQKFHSDPERQFAVLLEGDGSVMRWVKPGAGQFAIWYQRRAQYEPDFVVETSTEKLICEVKARNEVTSAEVQDKAHAARVWVGRANEHAKATGKKQWRYLLVPDDMITGSATLAGIAATCTMEPIIEAAGSSAA